MSKPTALADVIQDVHQTTPRVRHPGVVAISRERHRGAGGGATECDTTKHIQGLSSLSYEERLKVLGWTSLRERRERGNVILAYQHLHGNVEVDLDWKWILSTGVGLRANDAPRLAMAPPARNCQQREYFFSLRVARSWRNLPTAIANSNSLNELKNSYDKQ